MDEDCQEMCHCSDNRQLICSPKTCVEKASCVRSEQFEVHLCSPEDNCKLHFSYIWLELYLTFLLLDKCKPSTEINLILIIDSCLTMSKENFYALIQLAKDVVGRFKIGDKVLNVSCILSLI